MSAATNDGQWRLSVPGWGPRFYATQALANEQMAGSGTDHVVWFDAFDYARYNRGRIA